MHKDLHQLFGDLRDTDPSTASSKAAKIKPVKKATVASKPTVPKTRTSGMKALKKKTISPKSLEKRKLSKALKVSYLFIKTFTNSFLFLSFCHLTQYYINCISTYVTSS